MEIMTEKYVRIYMCVHLRTDDEMQWSSESFFKLRQMDVTLYK
jgi:hypothetical protein